ncbi:Bardet-Biedl syndrome 5 protein, partial [Perkinsus olseni]
GDHIGILLPSAATAARCLSPHLLVRPGLILLLTESACGGRHLSSSVLSFVEGIAGVIDDDSDVVKFLQDSVFGLIFMADTVMGQRSSASIGESTRGVWQDAEIRFDLSSSDLKLRRGEHEIDTINSVEDTKGNNGDRGVMIVTNLRVIWITAKKKARANLSIGWGCVQNINIKMVSSKLRGDTQAVFMMTKYNGQRFEFIFTSLVRYSPRI